MRRGQSTVELALMLPMVVGLFLFVIYVFRVNHTGGEETVQSHAEKIEKFNQGNGEIFDP